MANKAGFGLGIDAGGTYTDAVIYDFNKKSVIAKSKSLTTYHDLVEGIREAISQLPMELLTQVRVTSLSTTLATNSVVEGRGHKVGLIALSPWDWTEEQLGHSPCINVPGAVAISGEVIEPLNESACRKAARKLIERERCAAVVIAGYATNRNPALANRAREIVLDMYDVPVLCAHEISRRINAIHAAQTAITNAKLLPIIRDLIASTHEALADFNIKCKLMVVKGDGTPVDESVARARPVETILSGPAASVQGARVLTGIDDAMVLDIGGTTTDLAIVSNGHVRVSEDGSRIGSWVMSVDAVEVATVGLGGDSRIDFNRDRKIILGPTRNIPLSYLAHRHPHIMNFLMSFDMQPHKNAHDASAMDVLVYGSDGAIELNDREARLVDLLRERPMPVEHAASAVGLPSALLLSTSRLEECGIVKRSALTPTDLLHVTGVFTPWNIDAARRAVEIFAFMYGCPPEHVVETALGTVTRRLFEEIVRREWSREERGVHELPKSSRFFLNKAFSDDGRGLAVKMSLRMPVIAIGAPAGVFVPPVGRHLDTRIMVPEHADVANAIGAIASEIVVREEILIRPSHASTFILFGAEERIEFFDLEPATEKAIELIGERALKRAKESGAQSPRVEIMQNDRIGTAAEGSRVFLERKVTATASGSAFMNLA